MVVPFVVQTVMVKVQKSLLCLWAELVSFPRREATKLDLVLKKKKSREPFALGKQEEEKFPGPLDSTYL